MMCNFISIRIVRIYYLQDGGHYIEAWICYNSLESTYIKKKYIHLFQLQLLLLLRQTCGSNKMAVKIGRFLQLCVGPGNVILSLSGIALYISNGYPPPPPPPPKYVDCLGHRPHAIWAIHIKCILNSSHVKSYSSQDMFQLPICFEVVHAA